MPWDVLKPAIDYFSSLPMLPLVGYGFMVIGATGAAYFGLYKNRKDGLRIQYSQMTGEDPPKDMSIKELRAAIRTRGIEKIQM